MQTVTNYQQPVFTGTLFRPKPIEDGSPLINFIVNEKDQDAVSARDLHRFVESSERFSKWIDRMLEYGFVEGVDYTPYQKVHPLNKQSFQDYALTLDTAKEVAMIQRNDKGRIARQYFIECEKKLREITIKPIHIPQSGLVERITALEKLIKKMERAQVKAFAARRLYRRERIKQKQYEVDKALRDTIMINFGEYARKSMYTSWNDVWSRLYTDFAININSKKRYEGDHLLDVALREGVIRKVAETINNHWVSVL